MNFFGDRPRPRSSALASAALSVVNSLNLKTLGIIGARAGSKRVPGKNTRLFGGRPLVRWAIDAARAAKHIDRLVVSSDDEEVLELARSIDPQLALNRPQELAADESPAIDYVKHALDAVESQESLSFDAIVIIQPSSPFTLAQDIDDTLELLESSGAQSAVTVMKLDHAIHPIKLKTLEADRLLPYFEDEKGRMAAHELPELYVRNCSVYAARRDLIDEGKIIAEDCRAVVMPQERSIDINSELDFEFAEFMHSKRLRKEGE